jgi:iron complex outermembrane receptor protein
LKWVPSKNLTLTPAVMYQKVSTGDIDVSYTQLADGTPLPNNRTAKLVREPGRDQLLVPSLTVNYGMDFGDLTSVSSYFQRKFTRTQDGTTVNSPYLGSQIALPALAATVAALPSAVYLNNQIRQFSQEVRVASKPYDASVSPVTWLVGAYAANLHTSISDIEPVLGVNAAFAAAGVSITDPNVLAGAVSAGFPNDDSYTSLQRFHDQQQSVFGEANYYFTPGLHVTAGLRYLQATELFQRDAALYYANNGSNDGVASSAQNTRGTKATPKLALTWEASRTDTLYASASEGFRLGGGNVQIPETYCGLSAPNPLSYHSDSLWSYEVGDKSRFLNNRLSVNSSLFYVNWKDLQQQIVLPACGYAYNTNVGTAASYGAEVEVKAKPATGLEIDAALGLTHATLTNNAGAAAGIPGAVDGANVPGVPKFNLALSGSYNFSVTEDIFGFVRAAAHWTGSSNGALSSANPDYQRPAYSTVDASTGLSWDKWELSLFVKNLANNQKIIQRPEVQGTANEAYRIVPRTFGISLSAKF